MSDLFIRASYGAKDKTLAKTVTNGTLRVTNTNELYVDINDSRLFLGSIISGMTESAIKSQSVNAILPKVYISSDTNTLFWYDRGAETPAWVVIGGDSVAHAATADRATADEDGNNIKSTYMTKAEAASDHATINENIANLEETISHINSFEIRIVEHVTDLPVPGQSNIMYFVPNNVNSESNVYDEFIWIVNESEQDGGHYENIGTTEAALDNYYTKAQIDAQRATLETTIGNLDTAYKAADTALGARIDGVESTHATDKAALEGGIADNAAAIEALEGTVSDMDTAYKAADTALGGRIDTLTTTVTNNKAAADATQADLDVLEADVATINRWKKRVVDELPTTNIDEYTIYFVPENGLPGDDKKYGEYLYIGAHTIPASEPGEEDVVIPAHFERIDSTIDFSNYYTKSEIVTIKNNLQANITTNANNISALSQTVTDNENDIEAKHTAMDARVTAVEQAIGGGSGGSLSSRMDAVELTLNGNEASGGSQKGLVQEVADNKTTSDAAELALRNRATALEGVVGAPADYPSAKGTVTARLAGIDTEIGTNNTANTIKGRVTVNETDITAIKGYIGTYPTAAGTHDIATRLDDIETAIGQGTATDLATRMTRAENKVTVLETAMGSYPTGDGVRTVTQRLASLESTDTTYGTRLDTAEDDIDAIEANIGTYDVAEDGTIASRLDNIESAATTLTGRVSTNEGAITAINGKIGTYPQNADTIAVRLADIEEAIGEGSGGSLADRITALESDLSDLSDTVDDNETDIEEKVAALDDKIDAVDAAYKAADSDINDAIGELRTAIGNINKFKIVVLEVGEDLPVKGELYTLYFVPNDILPDNTNVYDEYMWVEKEVEDPETHETTTVGSYEKVGVTEADFGNYYTKDEVDGFVSELEDADTALGGRIDDLDAAYKAADALLEAADTALAGRATVLENAVGSYPTAVGTKTIATRLDDIEDAIGGGGGESITDRLDSVEGEVDDIQAQIGTYPQEADPIADRLADIETAIGDNQTANSIKGRIKTAEDDIDALEGRADATEANIGTYDLAQDGTIASRLATLESTDEAYDGRLDDIEANIGTYDVDTDGTIASRLETLEATDTSYGTRITANEGDIDTIQAQIGEYPDMTQLGARSIATRLDAIEEAIGDGDSAESIVNRLDQAEDDIDALEGRATDLEEELATHDFKYAGSQTENGAADNVVETASTADAERPVLFANADKDAVEYNNNITANPSAGTVTMTALKLGAATITFDSNTESLVVNF